MLGRRKSPEPDADGTAAVSGDGVAGLPDAGAVAAGGRADAFVSYSRSDKDFVERQLVPGLEARGKHVWLDLKDIEGGADWRERLSAGIRGARAFVFVISPSSVESKPCRDELAQARGLGKPFVPIVRVDVAPEQVPEELERSQWIFFRATDPVDKGLDEVVKAVDADLDWRDKHNELTIQAHDWLARDKDKSTLLRGGKLKEAEAWQADPGPHRESPTAEQAAFILAGRRAASRRQRILIGAVGLALVVALGLAGFALLQRNQAISREKTATSLALTSASRDQLASHLDESLLLSLEANRARPTVQAENSMISALEKARGSGVEAILRGHHGYVFEVAFSADGHTLATKDGDRKVRLWNVHTHKQLGQPLSGTQGDVDSVAFSPDGHTLAGISDGSVWLWDQRTPNKPGDALAGDKRFVTGFAFSQDGHTLAAAGNDGTMWLWDIRTPKKRGHRLAGRAFVTIVAFGPEGHTLAGTDRDGTVWLWDIRTPKKGVQPVTLKFPTGPAAFGPDGHTLAVAGEYGPPSLWDIRTPKKPDQPLPGPHGTSVNGLAFSPDGHMLAAAYDDGRVWLWDIRTQRKRGRLLPPGQQFSVTGVAFSADGRTLAAAGADGTVWLWDTHEMLGRPLSRGGRLGSTVAAFSPDEHTLAAGGPGGMVLWDVRTPNKLGRPLTPHRSVTGIAFGPDGHTLAGAGGNGRVWLWDLRAPDKPARPLTGKQGSVSAVAFSPDEHTLAAAYHDGTLRLWDIRIPDKPGRTFRLKNLKYGIDSAAFSPDGHTLATAATKVWLYDVRTPMKPGRPLNQGAVIAVTFSPDGHTLAAGDAGGGVRLWDIRRTGRPGPPLAGNGLAGSGVALAFTPDGRTLATADFLTTLGLDRKLRLWDVRTRQRLGPPLVDPSPWDFVAVAFSPDGRTLATVGDDGTVRLWKGILWHDGDDLKAQVCGLVVGNLTKAEWDRLAPGLSHGTTCPG